MGDEKGTSLVGAFFQADLQEMAAMKHKMDAAKAALEKVKANPAQTGLAEQLVDEYLANRNLWTTRVNQVVGRLRKYLPNHVDQEGLAIMRDFFGHSPLELKSWLDGTHPVLQDLQGDDYRLAMENIQRLRPAIERAMNPTPQMKTADRVLTVIADATAKEGMQRGILDGV